MPTPLQNIIADGRCCVRLIEAADHLLGTNPPWTERLLLRLVRALYTRRLRGLVAVAPADVTAEILAGSDRLMAISGGVVGDVGVN